MLIYETVKAIAEKRGISLKQLEVKAGIGNGTIGKWRESAPSVDTLKKVADALDVTVSTLVKGV